MTYVVLVILIALWAMVLLPPYLKDRRASHRTYRSVGIGTGGMSAAGSAQRFLPLQHASTAYATSAVSSPTGMRTSGRTTVGSMPQPSGVGSNVVPLRPAAESPAANATATYAGHPGVADETALHRAWPEPNSPGLGMPVSTAAARERRRHVLLGLTGLAFVTLLLALFAGGNWIAFHVFVDVAMLGYVILLVRHRQLAADRSMKVEPIRPPVSEQPLLNVQIAPSYLLQSGTGS